MRTSQKMWSLMITIVVVFGVTGCTTQITATPSQPPVADITTTVTLHPSDRTATGTNSPTTAEIRETSEPSRTNTIAPTYSQDQAITLVGELLQTNAGCKLPCWWGFTPGKTKWQDAREFLARLGREIYNPFSPEESIQFAGVFVEVPEDISSGILTHTYTIHDGIIYMIEVDPGRTTAYSIPAMLSTYGAPTEIRIWTFSEAWQDFFIFTVFLFYPDQGIMANYTVDATKVGNRVQGCFSDDVEIVLALWSPEDQLTYIEASEQASSMDISEWGIPVLLEEATELSPSDFYVLFTDPNNEQCVETPDDLWALP